ncbi:MAG: PRC-barrel domain-containing protein, partial [Actinomycetota bacterium]|nr:PRC-barrel domain-containing protein [Actinomycetota bacterium]
ARRDDLTFPRSEGWVRDHMIARIPGAQRSSSGKEPGGTADGRTESPSASPERRSDGLASRVRASSLLGTAVLDRDGRSLGRLRDLRLRADGDDHRIEGLVTGRGVIAERFGYAYEEVVGPWLVVALMRRLARRTRYIPWNDVVEIATERLVVSQTRDAYEPLVRLR